MAQPALPDGLVGFSRSAQLEAWRDLEGLKPSIKYYYSGNAAMLSENQDLIHPNVEGCRGYPGRELF